MVSRSKSGWVGNRERHPLIRTQDVHFAYFATCPVVNGVSLSLGRGMLGALIGSNGSGKSTVICLLAGLLRPKRGQVFLGGAPLAALPKRQLARQLAYVPQNLAMVFPFTALEVVLTGRSLYTPRFRFESRQDSEKACTALKSVGALHLAHRPATQLSGGERQLVAFARALAQEPDCLLLDEPSASLDLKYRAGLIQILRRLRHQEGLTALVVTHDLQLLEPAFDRVFAIRRGRVIAEGKPSEVLKDAVLSMIYDDPDVHTQRLEGRTFVWSGA
jgi:iron complex transport system ATP-binding protein